MQYKNKKNSAGALISIVKQILKYTVQAYIFFKSSLIFQSFSDRVPEEGCAEGLMVEDQAGTIKFNPIKGEKLKINYIIDFFQLEQPKCL